MVMSVKYALTNNVSVFICKRSTEVKTKINCDQNQIYRNSKEKK